MKFDESVRKTLEQGFVASPLARLFLDKTNSRPRYAIGKNMETLAVHRLVPLTGIVDDFSSVTGHWNGIPLLKTVELEHGALIVNCSTSISPVAVLAHLTACGLKNVVGIHELVHASDGCLEWPSFVLEMRRELELHFDSWQRIYSSLADDASRQTFIDVVRYRLTADPKYMRGYRVRLNEQYFEDFMQFSNEVFVDAGGFDGDTSETFSTRYGDYRKILFFEPSKNNMAAARERLASKKRIEYYPIGLSDKAGTLQFNQDAGSASSVTDDGGETITVDTLDAIVLEPVSFIKMDLEGWELKALEGAREHIRTDHPKLAIAVYHESSDFRRVFEFIEKFGLNYHVFLRHYTQGWSETIMFFVPCS